MLELLLYVTIGAGLAMLVEGLASARSLRRRIDRAWRSRPVDDATGLLNERAYLGRVTAELKRAQRDGRPLWLGVWSVVDGDPDRFGRGVADGLQFPEVGFRLSDRIFCFVRPSASPEARADLMGRLRRATPRERALCGEATYTPTGPTDAMRLLHSAIDAMG